MQALFLYLYQLSLVSDEKCEFEKMFDRRGHWNISVENCQARQAKQT